MPDFKVTSNNLALNPLIIEAKSEEAARKAAMITWYGLPNKDIPSNDGGSYYTGIGLFVEELRDD